MVSAQPVHESARLLGGDPAGIPVGRGYLSVQSHSHLQAYPRSFFRDVLKEYTVLFAELIFQQAHFHDDAMRAEDFYSFSADKRIRVGKPHDHTGDAGRQKGVRAGRLLSMVAAGLEGDVGRGTGRILRAGCQSIALRVQAAITMMISFADYPSVLDQDASYHRIRGRVTTSQFRKGHGLLHIDFVVFHHIPSSIRTLTVGTGVSPVQSPKEGSRGLYRQ